MKWSADYETGFPAIDEQHRMLFKMTGDFRETLEAGQGAGVYGLLLQVLDRYARSHFGLEERCMEECRCPVAEENRRAHEQFVEDLAAFRRRYDAEGYDPDVARALVARLDDWLDRHICGVDRKLRDHAPR